MDPWNSPVYYFGFLLSQKGYLLGFSSKDRWIQLGLYFKNIIKIPRKYWFFRAEFLASILQTSWAGYSSSWRLSCAERCFVTRSPSLYSQWWQPQHLHFARCLLGWTSLWIENHWSKWTVCPCKGVSLRQSWEMLSAQHVCRFFLEIRRQSRMVPSISGTDMVFPTCCCFHSSHFCSYQSLEVLSASWYKGFQGELHLSNCLDVSP